MPAFATPAPNTHSIGTQIVSYLSTLTYPSTLPVYDATSLEAYKDVTDLVAGGGVCAEVYGDNDIAERRGFGGRVWHTQTWFLVSMCSLDTAAYAAQIYDVRDALVQPFLAHATLGTSIFNLFNSELLPNGKFTRILRNSQFLRAYIVSLQTQQESYVPTPPGITA
jgi:hypothetical protein